jgi:ankyrin repeat protein
MSDLLSRLWFRLTSWRVRNIEKSIESYNKCIEDLHTKSERLETELRHQAGRPLDYKNRSALHLACLDGDLYVVEQLLADEPGRLAPPADINLQDRDGRTCLHYACRSGHTNIVLYLIEQGADMGVKDVHGWRAVDAARFNGKKEVIAALRQHGHAVSPTKARSARQDRSDSNLSDISLDISTEPGGSSNGRSPISPLSSDTKPSSDRNKRYTKLQL